VVQSDRFFASRSWQSRRIIWTDSYIVFSRVDREMLIDSIPLCEIKSVEQWKENVRDSNGQTVKDDSPQTHFQNSLQKKLSFINRPVGVGSFGQKNNSAAIDLDLQPTETVIGTEVPSRTLHCNVIQMKTVPEGHNSGRTYYLRTKDAEDSVKLMTALPSLVKSAKNLADKKSRFEKNQLLVRSVYTSRTVQYLMAAMIFGVVAHFTLSIPVPCPF
jgi:hypothetical protein